MVKVFSSAPAGETAAAAGAKPFCSTSNSVYFAIPITVDTEARTLCKDGSTIKE